MKALTFTLSAAALATLAFANLSSGSASAAGKSPFCYGGSPTPKYVCDAIKANTKPKPAVRTRHDTAKNAISNMR